MLHTQIPYSVWFILKIIQVCHNYEALGVDHVHTGSVSCHIISLLFCLQQLTVFKIFNPQLDYRLIDQTVCLGWFELHFCTCSENLLTEPLPNWSPYEQHMVIKRRCFLNRRRTIWGFTCNCFTETTLTSFRNLADVAKPESNHIGNGKFRIEISCS